MASVIPAEILDAFLDGSHSTRYVVDALYDGMPSSTDLPVSTASGSISQSRSTKLRDTGRLYVISGRSPITGRTLEPTALRDPLAPFGQELDVRLEVSVGGKVVGTTPVARYVIDDIPDSTRTARKITNDAFVAEGAHVEVAFSGQLSRIDADDFSQVYAPVTGASTWDEIRRFSPLPVVVSLADKTLSQAVVYSRSRLDTLEQLAQHLGGVLHITRDGSLTVRAEFPTLPTDLASGTVDVDLTGTIRDMGNSFSRSIYNKVIVTSSQAGAVQIVSVAQITDGPLSVNGPLGPRVYNRSSPLIDTQAEADADAATTLARVSSAQTKSVKVNCLPNPVIELGDTVRAVDPNTGRREVGICDKIDWSLNPSDLMAVTILIPQEVIPWA